MNTKRGRARGLAILASAGFLAVAAGCAKSPTVVNVQVAVDDTVPPLMLLQSTIALQTAPEKVSINAIVSRYEGDAGLAGPFIFPMLFPVAVPLGWAGEVVITVDGLSVLDGKQVIATGTTLATATREKTTEAAVTLTGVPGSGSGDGGVASDASAGGDAAGGDGGDNSDAETADTD